MKIEIDISPENIVDQVAKHLMGYVYAEHEAASWDPDEEREPETTAPKFGRDKKTIAEMVKDVVMERTRRAVDQAVTDITVERVTAAVDGVLAEGWQNTSSWGEPQGPKLDLKGRIAEILKESVEGRNANGYSTQIPRIDAMVRKALDEALAGVFKREIDEAAKKLREQIDKSVAAKLGETLKNALGLR